MKTIEATESGFNNSTRTTHSSSLRNLHNKGSVSSSKYSNTNPTNSRRPSAAVSGSGGGTINPLLLCFPNGRSPNISGNGVGYHRNPEPTTYTSRSYPNHSSDSNPDLPYQPSHPTTGNYEVEHGSNNNNFNFELDTLNNSIHKLTNSVELMCSLLQIINPHYSNLQSTYINTQKP